MLRSESSRARRYLPAWSPLAVMAVVLIAPACAFGMTPAEFCDKAFDGSSASKRCTAADRASLRYLAGPPGDGDATWRAVCDALIEGGVATGRLRFDARAAGMCIARLEKEREKRPVSASIYGLRECANVVVGLVPLGGACRASEDCVNALVCEIESKAAGGRCREPAVGQPCRGGVVLWFGGDHPTCGAGAECDGGTCRPHVAAGGACSLFGCGPGLTCADERCEPVRSAGGKCATRLDCASGLICRRTPGADSVCGKPGKRGSACVQDQDCSGRCEIPPGMSAGRCATFCGEG